MTETIELDVNDCSFNITGTIVDKIYELYSNLADDDVFYIICENSGSYIDLSFQIYGSYLNATKDKTYAPYRYILNQTKPNTGNWCFLVSSTEVKVIIYICHNWMLLNKNFTMCYDINRIVISPE